MAQLTGAIQRDPKLMETGIPWGDWQSMIGRHPGGGEKLTLGGVQYEVTDLGGSARGLRQLGGGAGGAMTGGVDVIAQAQKLYEQEQKWKAPAIASLEAGRGRIPGIFDPQRATLEAEKDPLKQRYESLLKDITGKTERAVGAEFGRRGIPLSSGLYEKTLGEQIAPQAERIGLERETGLRELTRLQTGLGVEEAGMGMDIDRAIAQIQAATGQGAVQAATTLYDIQQRGKQSEADRAIQQALADIRGREMGLAEEQWGWQKGQPSYLTLGEGATVFDPTTGQPIYKAPKTYKPTFGGGDVWE